jgi:hypothetical protein
VGDAEPLLLVDDEQAEVAKLHVLRQQAVCPDDDLDTAVREILEDLFLLSPGPEPADHVDAHRERGKPFGQRLQVLEGQDGGRRQNGHLLAVHHRLECRPRGDLGLAVAHVAAEKPVHGRWGLHVALDVGDGRLLVRRQLVLERVLELLLPVRVGAERVPRDGLARGIELEQFTCHVTHGPADARLRPLPTRPAEPVERRARRAGVLLDEIEPLDGNEELVVTRVVHLQKLLCGVRRRPESDLPKPDEHADAVIDVDHQVVDFEVAEV